MGMLRLHNIELTTSTRKSVTDKSVCADWLAEAYLCDAHYTKVASFRYITGPLDAPVEELDEFGDEVLKIVPILRKDYWETGDICGEFLWVHSATLQPEYRGVGLGAVLTGVLIDQATRARDFGLLACYAGPLGLPVGDPHEGDAWALAQMKISAVWKRLGLVSAAHDPHVLHADLRYVGPSQCLDSLIGEYQERGDREGWVSVEYEH